MKKPPQVLSSVTACGTAVDDTTLRYLLRVTIDETHPEE
jgi:hypothetical protein